MCSLTLGLMGAQMAMQLGSQYAQGKAQEQAYKVQAQQAKFNAAAQAHQTEKIAEQYAVKQRQLNDKFKLAQGNATAQFGASGLDSSGGSYSDLMSASQDAYDRDTNTLLSNQHEDTWASYVQQVNYKDQMNAYNQMAHNTKKQNLMSMAGTLLSGASSMYGQGYKEGLWGGSKSATAGASSPYVGYNYGGTNTGAMGNYAYSGIPVKQGYNTFNWGMR